MFQIHAYMDLSESAWSDEIETALKIGQENPGATTTTWGNYTVIYTGPSIIDANQQAFDDATNSYLIREME